jgi:hypothetical protein
MKTTVSVLITVFNQEVITLKRKQRSQNFMILPYVCGVSVYLIFMTTHIFINGKPQ